MRSSLRGSRDTAADRLKEYFRRTLRRRGPLQRRESQRHGPVLRLCSALLTPSRAAPAAPEVISGSRYRVPMCLCYSGRRRSRWGVTSTQIRNHSRMHLLRLLMTRRSLELSTCRPSETCVSQGHLSKYWKALPYVIITLLTLQELLWLNNTSVFSQNESPAIGGCPLQNFELRVCASCRSPLNSRKPSLLRACVSGRARSIHGRRGSRAAVTLSWLPDSSGQRQTGGPHAACGWAAHTLAASASRTRCRPPAAAARQRRSHATDAQPCSRKCLGRAARLGRIGALSAARRGLCGVARALRWCRRRTHGSLAAYRWR